MEPRETEFFVVVVVVDVCRVPAANAPGYTAACRLIVRPLVFRRSKMHRQVSFTSQRR